MNRRNFVTSSALAAVGSATYPTPASAKPKRALMKLGATVFGGGFREGGRGEFPGGAPQAGTPQAGTPQAEGARSGRRTGGPPRDPEQGFKSLGRWGIKNVVATPQGTKSAKPIQT